MSEPLVIVGNGMAAARLVDELTAPLRLNVPSMVPAAAAALLHRTEREDRMNTLMVSTPATGHINPLLGVARVLIAEGHNVVCLSGSALRDRIESAGEWNITSCTCRTRQARTMRAAPIKRNARSHAVGEDRSSPSRIGLDLVWNNPN